MVEMVLNDASLDTANVEEVALIDILKSIRAFQKANRFIVRAYAGSSNSILENHALLEIDSMPGASVSALVSTLQVPKTTLARCLSELMRRRIIGSRKSQADARKNTIALTSAGATKLAGVRTGSNALVVKSLQRLEPREQLVFQQLFRRFVGDLAGGAGHLRDLHPVNQDVICFTRGAGLLRSDLFERFGLSALECHTLIEVLERRGIATAKEIGDEFEATPTTIANVTKSLSKKRLIARVKSAHDARCLQISVTDKGRKLLNEIHSAQAGVLRRGFAGFSSEERNEFARLLAQFVGRGTVFTITDQRLELRELVTGDERSAGRRLLLEMLLMHPDSAVPERLLSAENVVIGVFLDGVLSGVYEFAREKNGVALAQAHVRPEGIRGLQPDLLERAARDIAVRAKEKWVFAEKCG